MEPATIPPETERGSEPASVRVPAAPAVPAEARLTEIPENPTIRELMLEVRDARLDQNQRLDDMARTLTGINQELDGLKLLVTNALTNQGDATTKFRENVSSDIARLNRRIVGLQDFRDRIAAAAAE